MWVRLYVDNQVKEIVEEGMAAILATGGVKKNGELLTAVVC